MNKFSNNLLYFILLLDLGCAFIYTHNYLTTDWYPYLTSVVSWALKALYTYRVDIHRVFKDEYIHTRLINLSGLVTLILIASPVSYLSYPSFPSVLVVGIIAVIDCFKQPKTPPPHFGFRGPQLGHSF